MGLQLTQADTVLFVVVVVVMLALTVFSASH